MSYTFLRGLTLWYIDIPMINDSCPKDKALMRRNKAIQEGT
jgi:hypothetical protein